jgi:hypothetical protein
MSTIDPTKAVPQVPLALRATVAAGVPKASRDDEDDDDRDEDDEDEDPDSSERGTDLMGQHEPMRAAAEEACAAAADAYKASKGSDSAAALMHAEEMSAKARSACLAAEGTSSKLRGMPAAEEQAPPTSRTPGAPPPPAKPAAVVVDPIRVSTQALARAIAASGGDAAGQAKIAASVAFADRMLALFGVASLDEAEGAARAAMQDAAEVPTLRAAAEKARKRADRAAAEKAEAALVAEVSAAVRAGKWDRAELFDVAEVVGADGKPAEVLTLKSWVREMSPKARTAMIAAKQAKATAAGSGPATPDDTATPISAAVADYCARRGITDPKKIAALAAAMTGATAPQMEPA